VAFAFFNLNDQAMEEKLILAQSLKQWLAGKDSAICKILCHENIEAFCTTKFGNYIARRKDLLSFLPPGKPHEVNDDGTWKKEHRQEIKPARLVQKLLLPGVISNMGLTSKDFEEFANAVKASQVDDEDFELAFRLVQGHDIYHYYLARNYSHVHDTGTMDESCMKHSSCTAFLQVYAENPGQVSLLVLLDKENRTVGRALVWHIDPGTVIMDRIYASDSNTQMFRDYAAKQGWLYKARQCAREDEFTSPFTQLSTEQYFEVSLGIWQFEYYPYLDTFRYLDLDTGLLTNYVSRARKSWVSLYSTEGNTTKDDLVWSNHHDGYILTAGAAWVTGIGYVWINQAYQDNAGRWHLKEKIMLVDGTEHFKHECTELKGLGWIRSIDRPGYRYVKDRRRYYPLDELILVRSSRTYIHRDDAVSLPGGSICHKKNVAFIIAQGAFIPVPGNNTSSPLTVLCRQCTAA